MSKDQKKTVKFPVETVENLKRLLDFIPSTIEFWQKEKEYPFNLICDLCEDITYFLTQNIIKNKED